MKKCTECIHHIKDMLFDVVWDEWHCMHSKCSRATLPINDHTRPQWCPLSEEDIVSMPYAKAFIKNAEGAIKNIQQAIEDVQAGRRTITEDTTVVSVVYGEG